VRKRSFGRYISFCTVQNTRRCGGWLLFARQWCIAAKSMGTLPKQMVLIGNHYLIHVDAGVTCDDALQNAIAKGPIHA
jgi:hypothetical protein